MRRLVLLVEFIAGLFLFSLFFGIGAAIGAIVASFVADAAGVVRLKILSNDPEVQRFLLVLCGVLIGGFCTARPAVKSLLEDRKSRIGKNEGEKE